jgi:hypothetical protein
VLTSCECPRFSVGARGSPLQGAFDGRGNHCGVGDMLLRAGTKASQSKVL